MGSITVPTFRSSGSPPTTSGASATDEALADVDGILIPGGFGVRGVEGKVAAVRYARERAGAVPGHLPRACSAR